MQLSAAAALRPRGLSSSWLRRDRDPSAQVDGLDAWGYDEARQKAVAGVLRSKFSAAASVAPRKGTEDNAKKKFFSIMVQGKYAEQIAECLRSDFGVFRVTVQAKKGLLTKKDRAAFSGAK